VAADLEIRWPSGQVDELDAVPANRIVTIVEGQGIAGAQLLSKVRRQLPPPSSDR
jgi:hypothetical protein